MGAEERFRRARQERERHRFDAAHAVAVKDGDARAMPTDEFGQTIWPGSLIKHYATVPPSCVVVAVAPLLDPRMPAGAVRMTLQYDLILPGGVPIPELLLCGMPEAAPSSDGKTPEVEVVREPAIEPAAESSSRADKPFENSPMLKVLNGEHRPRLMVTDAE